MYLSKSDFKVASNCPSKLYFKKKRYPSLMNDNPYLQFLADGGYMVEKMAKLLYPGGIEMESWDNPVKAHQEALAMITERESVTLFEPTILDGQRLVRVDILNKKGGILQLIEVKSASIDMSVSEQGNPFRGKRGGITSDWMPYLEDVTFQYLVLSRAFPNLEVRPYLCLVDKSKNATEGTTCNQFKLSRSTDAMGRKAWAPEVEYLGDLESLRKNHLLAIVDVMSEVQELADEVDNKSAEYLSSMSGDDIVRISAELSSKCKGCEYRTKPVEGRRSGFEECWGALAVQEPHILDLYRIGDAGGRNHNLVGKLAAEGRARMTDVPIDMLTSAYGSRQQQQLASLEEGEWLAPELTGLLRGHTRPLHFIDFEASQLALPYHEGMRAYELAAFQWSCHTIQESQESAVHNEWLNDGSVFPNFAFARSLREQIGDEGTVYVWSSYEVSRLKDIRRQMDQYGERDKELADWLDWMTEADNPRIVDMLKIAKDCYVHPNMKGSLSIKDVLPAAWTTNAALRERKEFKKYFGVNEAGNIKNPYDVLSPLPIGAGLEEVVKEGTGAMRVYQEMMFGDSANDPEIRQQYRQLLLQYCELDTAAMVIIWRHWAGCV
jgi:hypothetical protein